MADVDDYYKDLAARPKPNYDRNPNFQIKQDPLELSPADGSDGFVGSNTGEVSGLKVVSGKTGYSKDMPVWEEQSSMMGVKDNTGSEDGDAKGIEGDTDSTDEMATWKRPQQDEGMIQTYRDSKGAGDAGPTGSDEPDQSGGAFQGMGGKGPASYKTQENTQSVPDSSAGDHDMDMPQTEFTSTDGGGAPKFKHGG